MPDNAESCPSCGQKLAGGGVRQATATFSRRKVGGSVIEGSPYKPGDLVAGRYTVRDTLGGGPVGIVFRAHDKDIDVDVALKVINPKLVQTAEERRAFAKVLRNARKLSHPNLVRVYEEGEDQDRPFFTSQFLDGLTLRKIIDLRLAKGQFFQLREIEPIFGQVAAAIDAANKIGPHSDLKPDNVLVLPDLLKVTDFGLGLAIPRLPFVQAMKARKAHAYLAPELVDGRECDNRIDVYALGVILGEMLAGLTPDGSIPELQRRNPEVPQALEGLYRKALNENPNARFKSGSEFFGELQDLAKKLAPPPLKAKPEPAAAPSAARVRPATSAGLQLQPRAAKPAPPVPELPPPPPISEEIELRSMENAPGATQPVDANRLAAALGNPADREETEVVQSELLLAQDAAEAAALSVQRPPVEPGLGEAESTRVARERPREATSPSTGLWVLLLSILGVSIGGGGAYLTLKVGKKPAVAPTAAVDDRAAEAMRLEKERLAAKAAEEQAAAEALAAQRAAAERAAAEKAAAEKTAAEKTAGETAAAEKAAAEKAAAEKAAAEKLAAEKAEADRLSGQKDPLKARATEAARLERAELAKAAAERAAAEKADAARVAAEKLAAERERAKAAAPTPTPPPAKTVAVAVVASEGGCPEGMRPVPAGSFKMGTAADDPMRGFDERALGGVEVAAFCVDTFEFPNKRGASPTTNVGWADAKRLCEARGRRLCSEEEWEKACKGPGNARWPYGNAFDANACNTEDEAGEDRLVTPAGRFAKCRSGYGVADLSGNVAEWTSEKVQKGGGFDKPDFAVRCSARKEVKTGARAAEVGFRCCADLK